MQTPPFSFARRPNLYAFLTAVTNGRPGTVGREQGRCKPEALDRVTWGSPFRRVLSNQLVLKPVRVRLRHDPKASRSRAKARVQPDNTLR
ncbi:hypothetical protein BH18ACT14_BH18ACT14_04330 [soil metagenome]